jgi:hypothetical protein
MSAHDRPAKRIEWSPIASYALAFGGIALLGYFIVQIFAAKHLSEPFKVGAITVIVLIGIGGAMAILQRDEDERDTDDQRLYTAEEVAELLNAVRANGGRLPGASSATTATCVFCGRSDAEVRGLDGSRYHRACFQRAYRERAASSRGPTSLR